MSTRAPSSDVPTVSRDVGFWTAVTLVLGNMIGSGVFLLPASLAAYGGMSVVGWIVSAAGSVCLAVVFARLAQRDPAAGGPYAYTRRAFGELAGFLVAWGYWISTWCTTAALAVAFVGYLDKFIPSVVRRPPSAAALAIGSIWLLTLVNIRGVRVAGRVQVVTTSLKLVPLIVVGLAGLAAFAPANFEIAAPTPGAFGASLMAVVTLTLWAFLGLECATIPASAVRDPDRTIPRATVTGTIAAAMIYIVSTVGVMGLVSPATLGTSTAPFADAAEALWGPQAGQWVAAGAAISCFGALNGWVLVVGQLPMAVASDRLFPPVFARLSSRGTPARGLVIAAVLSSVLVAMNYSAGLVELFTQIILLATLSTLVPYAFCALAGFIPDRRTIRWPGTIGAAAFLYSLLAIAGAGADVVYKGFVLLLAGLPVYVWVVRRSG